MSNPLDDNSAEVYSYQISHTIERPSFCAVNIVLVGEFVAADGQYRAKELFLIPFHMRYIHTGCVQGPVSFQDIEKPMSRGLQAGDLFSTPALEA